MAESITREKDDYSNEDYDSFLQIMMNSNVQIPDHQGLVLPNQQDLQLLSQQIQNQIPPNAGNDEVDEDEPFITTAFQKAGKLVHHK